MRFLGIPHRGDALALPSSAASLQSVSREILSAHARVLHHTRFGESSDERVSDEPNSLEPVARGGCRKGRQICQTSLFSSERTHVSHPRNHVLQTRESACDDREVEDLGQFEKMMANPAGSKEDMKKFEEIMKDYHDLVDHGKREIYKIEG